MGCCRQFLGGLKRNSRYLERRLRRAEGDLRQLEAHVAFFFCFFGPKVGPGATEGLAIFFCALNINDGIGGFFPMSRQNVGPTVIL